jgi:hypothetical protein
MTPAGSRVFLQTTQQVQFALDEGRPGKSGRSVLSVRLDGCRIYMANNRRRIDTRYFATPVSGVSARQKGHDVEVRIALRVVANAVPHSEPGPDGTQFVVLDFPPGKATPAPRRQRRTTPIHLRPVPRRKRRNPSGRDLRCDKERAS